MMTIGSLFSGIGGLELGLERAGVGHVVWQVERNEWCRRVLARHWPGVTQHEDVQTVGAHNLKPVGVICGGFPCQDVSAAGKGAGLAGERSGLWREFARVVAELVPEWVVVENVASGAKRWVDPVVSSLGALGYEALPLPISASDVGAPHRRARIFVVARRAPEARRLAHPNSGGREAFGLAQHRDEQSETGAESVGCNLDGGLRWPPGPLDTEGWKAWARNGGPEPAIHRGPDGFPAGLDERLMALGNAVVPQCAEVAGHVILELLAGR